MGAKQLTRIISDHLQGGKAADVQTMEPNK